VERAADEAWWNLATSGTDETREEFVAAGKAYSELFSDADEYGKLRDLFEDLDSAESPLLRRRIEFPYRMFEERQGDEETLGRIEKLEAEANAIYASLTARLSSRSAQSSGSVPPVLDPLHPSRDFLERRLAELEIAAGERPRAGDVALPEDTGQQVRQWAGGEAVRAKEQEAFMGKLLAVGKDPRVVLEEMCS
jgi:hypothetical protein